MAYNIPTNIWSVDVFSTPPWRNDLVDFFRLQFFANALFDMALEGVPG